jgi:uncharacterized membrane protein required for colicin V production
MNIVDYCILGIIGISLIFGLYKGFVASVLNTGGALISFGLAFWLYPKFAGVIQSDPQLQRTLLSYTDAERRLGDLALGAKKVFELTQNEIREIVERANLPGIIGDLLRSNLTNRVFTGIDTVEDYVSETIVSACINIICFILAFLVLYLAVSLICSALKAVVQLPVLKQLNAVLGGAFGILRGVLFVFILFTVVPMVETVAPVNQVVELMEQSRLAALFNSGSLITAIMNGTLFQ